MGAILLCLLPYHLLAQSEDNLHIQVNPAENIENLVFDEFIKKGNCVKIENIQRIGDIRSIGSFKNAQTSIGIDEGIVFTTGSLDDIVGPNFSTGTTGGQYGGESPAPYLRQVVRNVPFFDVVGIEFDFTPTSDFVSFSYVFASEEYCEFVDSEFNDAFGFFVSGPGIEGDGFDNSINVAKIEQKEDAVTINNVNHLRNSQFFVNNLTRTDAASCGIDFGPRDLEGFEFDGYTTKLQAFFSVIPCETYHIRLVVGDVSDAILDSAVFLEGKSFESGAAASVRLQVNGQPDTLVYENCLDAQFIIDRSKLSDRENALEIDLDIIGTSTNGVDYELLPDNVILEAMEFRQNLPVTILPDDLTESLEYLDFIVNTTTCNCTESDTARLYIRDSKETLEVILEEAQVCIGQPFTLAPLVPDGIEPLFFQWENGDTTPTITDMITEPTAYAVTITDVCGATNNDNIIAQLQPIPMLDLAGDFTFCEGRVPEELLIDLPGQAPWTLNYAVDDGNTQTIENISESPYGFPLAEIGLYNFVGFNDRHCNGAISGEAAVEDISFAVNPILKSPSCLNANDGQIELDFLGGIAPYDITWSEDAPSDAVLTSVLAGDYSVNVVDQLGCAVFTTFTLPEAPAFARCNFDLTKNLYIPNVFSPNGDGINDGFTIFPKFGLIQTASFKIFDRWGGLVFESNLMDNPTNLDYWEGGRQATGVYFCLVELTLSNGDLERYGTDVTLVK